MAKDIKTIVQEINKRFGENTINYVKDMKDVDVERLSSGSLALDYILGQNKGVYGWPIGRAVELYGHFSSGKSLISLMTIAEAQKQGIDTVYIDAEHGFDKEFAEKMGVNTDKLVLSQVAIGEDVMDILTSLLETENKMVIVVDSVASLAPMKEMDESMEQHNIALTARLMSKALRKITALNKKALVMFINQIRISPGAYGNPETTSGGKALGHYASVRVEVRKGEPLNKNKKQIGQVVKFKVTKNKTSNPFGDGYFKFFYEDGLDKIDEMVTVGLLNKKIAQSGAFYEVAGEKFRGRETMEDEIRKDEKLFEKVKKEVLSE